MFNATKKMFMELQDNYSSINILNVNVKFTMQEIHLDSALCSVRKLWNECFFSLIPSDFLISFSELIRYDILTIAVYIVATNPQITMDNHVGNPVAVEYFSHCKSIIAF